MRPAGPDIEHYAKALVALGKAAGTLDRMDEDVHTARRLLLQDPSVLRFLKDPFIDIDGKNRALDELLADHVSPELRHMLRLLLERGDIDALDRVAEALSSVVAGQDEKTAGLLVSARALEDEVIRDIEHEVGQFIGREVSLRTEINPQVLGGIRVQVGDHVFDDTIAHHLDRMRAALAK